MAVQKIKTPLGEELVVLPVSEYEKLVDAADVAAADRIARAIAGGAEEAIPSEMVARLLSGESPVRVWRQYRRMTAKELAAKARISGAYLSEIESGKKVGSLATFKAIASVLQLDLDDLILTDES